MPSSFRSRLSAPPTLTSQTSWTDDLPICRNSGAGFSTNQIYQEDGHRREEHPFEDQCFHCRSDESTSLYCVFDGHEGASAAEFALQRMAAELLLGQLEDARNDADVKEILRQAFFSVEKSFMETMDDLVAEKTSLIFEIPDGLTSYEAYQKYPLVVEKLNSINTDLSCGTTAVAALIHNCKLFVANVGDSRALLCKTDSNGVLRVVQLSVDHDLSNQDEVFRLAQLGLSLDKLKGLRLGNQENTRCIGNYLVKGGYKEFEDLSSAISEPVIAEPEIHETVPLDDSCRFLMLMSDGLYKSLAEATGSEQVNRELALMAVEQFRIQSTLTGVAQAVVDKVVRIHHDMYMSRASKGDVSTGGKRDDITLLIRNFNYPMPNSLSNTIHQVRFDPVPTITNYQRPEPESDDVDELEETCKEIMTSLSAMDEKASIVTVYPLLNKLLFLILPYDVNILNYPVLLSKSYLKFSQVNYPRILFDLVKFLRPPVHKNVMNFFVLGSNGNPFTYQAAIVTLTNTLKNTKSSLYQDLILEIMEKLIKSQGLVSAAVLKSINTNFDDVSWKEMIQSLVSIPNRVANIVGTNLPNYCIPSNFVKIIYCHVIKIIQILKNARSLYKVGDDKVLSSIISKVVSNFGTVNFDLLLNVFEIWSVQDPTYKSIIQSIMKHLDRVSMEPTLISVFQKVTNFRVITNILPSSLLESQNWVYILLKKIPFMTYYTNNKILINYILYIGESDYHSEKSESDSLKKSESNNLHDLILELLNIWSDKSALNHTSFEQHFYVSKLILLACNFLHHNKLLNERIRKDIERKLLTAVPIHLDSSNEKIRVIGMITAESIIGYYWKPADDDSSKKLEFDYSNVKKEGEAIVDDMKVLRDFKFSSENCSTKQTDVEELVRHFEAVIEMDDGNAGNESQTKCDTNDVDDDKDSFLDSDDDLEPYDLSNDVKSSIKKQPKYLRDLKECLMEDKDFERWSAAVEVSEDLIKAQLPNEDVSFGIDLIQLLICSDAKFYSETFDDVRFSSCVAIVLVYPNEVATHISLQFHEVVNRYSIAQRLLMLDILAESAKQLSSPHLNIKATGGQIDKQLGCVISDKIRSNTRRKCRPKVVPKLKINEYSKACGSFFFPLIRGSLKNKEIMFRQKENNSANNIDDCNLLLVHFLNTLSIIMMAAVNCANVTRMAAELFEFVWWLRYHSELKVRFAVIHCLASAIFAVPSFRLIGDLITEVSEVKIWLEEIVSSGGISASKSNEVDAECRVFASQVLMFINSKVSSEVDQP